MSKKPWIPIHWHLKGSFFVLGCILFLAFWIRIQGKSWIPDGQFTGYDAYLYYWQAQIVSEQGHLPARDMSRWLPLGRDLGQTLNLYSYVLAYAHKAIAFCFPEVSLYQVCVYAPPVCFVIGLGALCIFLYHTYGLLFSAIAGVLLATFIGTIGRSAAGFGDRDSWCFMPALLATTTYLASLQARHPHKRLLWTLISGSVVFLGGLSWEAFGFFVLIILALELWKFCTTETEQHLKTYTLWVFMFVPGLFLVSPAYRSGYGFATYVAALLLLPPMVVFFIRSNRYLLLNFSERLRPYARHIAWFLTLSSIALGVYYIVMNLDRFDHIAYRHHGNRLMQSVGELEAPSFYYWKEHYGNFFLLGSLGLVIESLRIWKWKAIPLSTSLVFFFATTFLRWPISQFLGTEVCNTLFFASLASVLIGVGIASTRKEKSPMEFGTLFAIVWALLWFSLARGGKRFGFFIGIPIAFGTTSLLWHCLGYLIQILKTRLLTYVTHGWIITSVTSIAFALLFFFPPFGGHAILALKAAPNIRKAVPGLGEEMELFQWANATLPENTVMAAHWSYGSQLNVLGGVKTIIDQDHYIPHWIHFYYRHVFCGQSEREALTFLKTHGVTHLMLTQNRLISRAQSLSFIGSDASGDRRFDFITLHRDRNNTTETHTRLLPRRGSPLTAVNIVATSTERCLATLELETEDKISKEVVWDPNTPAVIDLGESGVILYFDLEGKPYIGYYIPKQGWNSLAVKLFIRATHSSAFVPIYQGNAAEPIKIKVWEICYPLEIKSNPKYLATQLEK